MSEHSQLTGLIFTHVKTTELHEGKMRFFVKPLLCGGHKCLETSKILGHFHNFYLNIAMFLASDEVNLLCSNRKLHIYVECSSVLQKLKASVAKGAASASGCRSFIKWTSWFERFNNNHVCFRVLIQDRSIFMLFLNYSEFRWCVLGNVLFYDLLVLLYFLNQMLLLF